MSDPSQSPVIRCRCRRCQTVLEFPSAMAGTPAYCPMCYLRLVVPLHSQFDPDYGQYSVGAEGWPWAESAQGHLSVVCPICGTRMYEPPQQAGRQVVCPDCGTSVTVPSAQQQPLPSAKPRGLGEYGVWEDYDPAAQPAARTEQLVRLYCRVCGMLMYAAIEEVGREISCPDCGSRTVVPPPPAPPPKTAADFRTPADQEYGVAEWHGQQAAESQEPERLIPVTCSTCNLRMYAYRWQVGQMLVCPDCARATVVPQPSDQPGPPGDAGPPAVRQTAPSPAGAAPARPRSRRIARSADRTAAPAAPSGWITYLTQGEVLRLWAGLSVAATVTAELGLFSVGTLMYGLSGVILGAFCYPGFCLLLAIWAVVTAVSFLAIVCDTANGAPRIISLPGLMFLDWLGDSLYLFVPLSVSTSIAGLIALALRWLEVQDPVFSDARMALSVLAAWAVLPVFVLSALIAGSPVHLISRDVLRSFRLAPLSWLKYYAASFLLWLLFWCLWFSANLPTNTRISIWALSLVCGALCSAILVHARLLGVLGRAVIRANSQWAEAADDAETEEAKQ